MNFELKQVIWAEGKTPTQPQTMSLRYRKQADPDVDDSYILVSDGLLVLENGSILNAPAITGLADNTSYVFRLNSYADDTVEVDVEYKTPDEEAVKTPAVAYYTNSRVNVRDGSANWVDMFAPVIGAYYTLKNDWTPATGYYGNLQTNSQVYTRAVADSFGFYIPANTGDMYIEGFTLPMLINNAGLNYYAMGVDFCMTGIDNTGTGKFPLMSCRDENGVGVFVYVDLATKKVYWEHTSETLKETLVSVGTVNYGAWNHVAVVYPIAEEGDVCTLYLNGDGTSTGTMGMANPITTASETTLVTIGTTQYNKGANAGKGYFRNFAATNQPVGALVAPIINPPKLNIVMTSRDANATRYVIPDANVVEQRNTSMGFKIPENIPAGKYSVAVEYGNKVSAATEITVLAFDKVKEAKVIDFTTDENAVTTFRNNFYLVAQGYSAADGGVAPENVYIRNGLLTLEAHGDGYTGTLQGYMPGGARKTHNYGMDPKNGKHWVERVGACVLSKEYYGYGSFKIQARLPREFGVVPTFFVTHSTVTKAQEAFANELGGKGMRASGNKDGEGIYVNMKQEFSMQLPTTDSHNTFNTMNDLLSAGWIRPVYLLKLDTLRVAIVNDPDPANNGTWELTTPADWKLKTGWTKISDTPHLFTQPFNNYVKVMNRLNSTGLGNGITAEPVNLDAFATYMLPAAGVNLWDGEFHEFRMDWNPSTISYYIDGVLIKSNNQMMPWIPGRFGMALMFPTEAIPTSPWMADESKLWQGKAPWRHQTMDIRKIEYTPFAITNRLIGETYPFDALREY